MKKVRRSIVPLRGKYKRRMTRDQVTEVEMLDKKNPAVVMDEFYRMLELIKPLIEYKKQDQLTADFVSEIGLSQTQFYWRLNNYDAWKKEELSLLFKNLGYK